MPETEGVVVAPPIETDDWTPDVEVVAGIVAGVPMECEVNMVHPCTIRHPQPAEFIMVWADCNCDPASPDYEGTVTICKSDAKSFMAELRAMHSIECQVCAFTYIPAIRIVREVVPV